MNEAKSIQKTRRRGERAMAVLLLTVALVVAAWELLAWRSNRPLDVMGEDTRFDNFIPSLAEWHVEAVEMPPDPQQIHIVAFTMRKRYPRGAVDRSPVQTRLVHGYNMRDCMRIKGYTVELLRDTRNGDGLPMQIWELKSSTGDRSVWVTTMLESTRLAATNVDVRSIPFPRVGTPKAGGGPVRGLTWESLRHPIRSLRNFFRARWNAARCDVATFLKLRQPAWVSGRLFTFVSSANLPKTKVAGVGDLTPHVINAHMAWHKAARDYLRSVQHGLFI